MEGHRVRHGPAVPPLERACHEIQAVRSLLPAKSLHIHACCAEAISSLAKTAWTTSTSPLSRLLASEPRDDLVARHATQTSNVVILSRRPPEVRRPSLGPAFHPESFIYASGAR